MTDAPLFVVGLGPGCPGLLTPRAAQALAQARCIAGYGVYLDLLETPLKSGKLLIERGMRQEKERCELAIRQALAGRPTAIVSSGDPGVYGMASLVVELLEANGLLERVPLEIIPGVPAVCAAAARVGAPIGHDFACISLSDLLTPPELIEKRLQAAFMADFVCALYNPRSKGRPHWLAKAVNMARQYRGGDCPVALCRSICRAGEETLITSLAAFDPALADMLSIVIIGNSQSRRSGAYMVTPRGYACGEKSNAAL